MYKNPFQPKDDILFVYDVNSEQWTVKENKLTKEVVCCTKVPVV